MAANESFPLMAIMMRYNNGELKHQAGFVLLRTSNSLIKREEWSESPPAHTHTHTRRYTHLLTRRDDVDECGSHYYNYRSPPEISQP